MKVPLCPRCNKEAALVDTTYGILPGVKCQEEDDAQEKPESPEFYNQSKQDRVQEMRDKHNGDIEQPYIQGKDMSPNPDFVKAYPQMAKEYFSTEQLEKM